MIRKVIIVALTLGAVGTGILWAASYRQPRTPAPFPTWALTNLRMGAEPWPRNPFTAGKTWLWRWRVSDHGHRATEARIGGGAMAVVRLDYLLAHRGSLDASLSGPRAITAAVTHGETELFRVPLLVLSALLATYPAIALVRGPLRRCYRRRYRRRHGLCIRCGYNLTGNVSGVCTECGTEIEQP